MNITLSGNIKVAYKMRNSIEMIVGVCLNLHTIIFEAGDVDNLKDK